MTSRHWWVVVASIAVLSLCLSLFLVKQIGVGQREAQKTRDLLKNEVDATRQALLNEISGQAFGLRTEAMQRADAALRIVDRNTRAAVSTANTAVSDLNTRLEVLDGLKPALQNLTAITATVQTDLADGRKATEAALNPEDVAGAVRDTRFFLARAARTAGHVEAASDAFQASVPQMIAGWNRIIANSDQATAATAATMKATAATMANFREASRPLPTWIRMGLQIAPPIAQAGAAAAERFEGPSESR